MNVHDIPTDLQARLQWASDLEDQHHTSFGPDLHTDLSAAAAAVRDEKDWQAPIRFATSADGTKTRWGLVLATDGAVGVQTEPVDPDDVLDMANVLPRPPHGGESGAGWLLWAVYSIPLAVAVACAVLIGFGNVVRSPGDSGVVVAAIPVAAFTFLLMTIAGSYLLGKVFGSAIRSERQATRDWDAHADQIVAALPYSPDDLYVFRDALADAADATSDGRRYRRRVVASGTDNTTGDPIDYRITTNATGRLVPEYGVPGTLEKIPAPARRNPVVMHGSDNSLMWTGIGVGAGLLIGNALNND